jgi:hypothetical protein
MEELNTQRRIKLSAAMQGKVQKWNLHAPSNLDRTEITTSKTSFSLMGIMSRSSETKAR